MLTAKLFKTKNNSKWQRKKNKWIIAAVDRTGYRGREWKKNFSFSIYVHLSWCVLFQSLVCIANVHIHVQVNVFSAFAMVRLCRDLLQLQQHAPCLCVKSSEQILRHSAHKTICIDRTLISFFIFFEKSVQLYTIMHSVCDMLHAMPCS